MTTRQPSMSDVPGLFLLWDLEAGGTGPQDVTAVSPSARHWRSRAGPDHVWSAPVANVHRSVRGGSRGCPYCAGKKVSVTNRLDLVAPEVAAQWHPRLNGDLTPEQVVAGSTSRCGAVPLRTGS